MKNRYIAISLCLLTTFLLFSGCGGGGGGNSIFGGSFSLINDSNPFVGTWISNTTSDQDGQTYRYDQYVFTNERFTVSYVDHPNWGSSNSSNTYTYEISAEGTWYFLTDGNHIYIKPTKHNDVYVNPAGSCSTSVIAGYASDRDTRWPLNVEKHYTYAMNDAKTQFTITNVANPSETSTWTRR